MQHCDPKREAGVGVTATALGVVTLALKPFSDSVISKAWGPTIWELKLAIISSWLAGVRCWAQQLLSSVVSKWISLVGCTELLFPFP